MTYRTPERPLEPPDCWPSIRWIGSTAYNSINLPMEPEEEDEKMEREEGGTDDE